MALRRLPAADTLCRNRVIRVFAFRPTTSSVHRKAVLTVLRLDAPPADHLPQKLRFGLLRGCESRNSAARLRNIFLAIATVVSFREACCVLPERVSAGTRLRTLFSWQLACHPVGPTVRHFHESTCEYVGGNPPFQGAPTGRRTLPTRRRLDATENTRHANVRDTTDARRCAVDRPGPTLHRTPVAAGPPRV